MAYRKIQEEEQKKAAATGQPAAVLPDLKPSAEAAAAVAAAQITAAGRTSTAAGRTSTAAGQTSTAAGRTSTTAPSTTASQPGGKLSFAEFEKAAKKLKMLLDNGIISQEEFDTEKQRLVSNMEI